MFSRALPSAVCRCGWFGSSIINHVGKRFRHTVVALDNNFEAAEALAADCELMPPPQNQNGGSLRAIARGSMTLHRVRPDLLMTYNWGSIRPL
jgi:hypothetical protein